jgi:hypothetical protein
VVGVIILGVLAVLFVILILVLSGQPENQGPGLGHNSPYPDTVLGPSPLRPRLGTPESLESHMGVDWVDQDLQRERRRDPEGDG